MQCGMIRFAHVLYNIGNVLMIFARVAAVRVIGARYQKHLNLNLLARRPTSDPPATRARAERVYRAEGAEPSVVRSMRGGGGVGRFAGPVVYDAP